MLDEYNKYLIDTYDPVDFVVAKGKGSRLYDNDGHEVIDFSAGVAVNCLGHSHPELINTLIQQANRLWHCSNIMTNHNVIKLAAKLLDRTCFDKAFFCNSGTEAVEAGLKLGRRYATQSFNHNKNQIVSFKNSFHGRTLFAVSTGGQAKYSQDFGPLPLGINHGNFNDPASAEALINNNTAVVITEIIQAEGGVIPANIKFLSYLRNLCDKHHAILMYDEVQTGIGRTGTFFAHQQYPGCEPDLISVAKGLGGGFPIGAILVKEKFCQGFTVGSHGSTFGGNPLATAVASSVVDIVNKKEFLAQVESKSKFFVKGLKTINNDLNIFEEIRGAGLLIGAVLTKDYIGQAKQIVKLGFKHGLSVLTATPNVIRFTPALNISTLDITEGLRRFNSTLDEFIRLNKKSEI